VELRDAFGQIQADAEMQLAELRKDTVRSQLATAARLTDLAHQVDTLRLPNEAIERQRAASAREHEALD
jgi:hypothetical protein